MAKFTMVLVVFFFTYRYSCSECHNNSNAGRCPGFERLVDTYG